MRTIKNLIIGVTLLAMATISTGCGEDKVIEGKEYETCGLINKANGDCMNDPTIKYNVSIGNVIWGIILAETVIAPIYFFGFSMFNPDHKIVQPQK
jgi:hypothetical protein